VKIRELLVAIKVTVQDMGAKKLADALDGIVKRAPKVNDSLASTERAAAKAAREQERAARQVEAAKKREAKEAEKAAAQIVKAAKAEEVAAAKAAREVERSSAKASGARKRDATEAERAAKKVELAARVEQRAVEKAAREIEKAERVKVRAIEKAAADVEKAKAKETRAFEKQLASIRKASDKSIAAGNRTARGNTDRSERLEDLRSSQRQEVGGAMGSAGGSLATGAGAFVGGMAVAGGLALQTAAEFEGLRQQLKNILGDAGKAEQAFGGIKKVAASTPFELQEVTKAFIDLKVRGVEPTDEKLTALGDLSSTFGHSITDMTESIAAAARGELDSVEKFGVAADTLKDGRIALSFKGQRVEIERTAEAVTDALVEFGKMDGVTGAMAGQVGTLNGQWSNFKDAMATAIDEAVTASGALDEAKGLLGDLTGSADGAASAFGTVLADGLKTAREWLSTLTAEDIQGWLDRAVDAGTAMIDMISGAVKMFMSMAEAAGSLSEKLDLSETTITTITLALGAMMLAGGGLPGLFAATAIAAAAMGTALADAYADVSGLTDEMWLLDQSIKEHQANMLWIQARYDKELAASQTENQTVADLMARGLSYSEAKSQANRGKVAKTDERRARADQRFEDISKANQSGFGEELFATAKDQGSLLETGNRAGASQDLTDEQKAFAVAGNNVGLTEKAVRAKKRIAAATADDLEKTRKAGGDVTARAAGLAANEAKARKAFTEATRKGKTEEEAMLAAEKALTGEETKKGNGGKGKKSKDPAQMDILEQLGLKGPGSILENRPSPQSLTISLVITIKGADSIPVTINMPAGATLAEGAEAAGQEVGTVLQASIVAQLQPVVEDSLALRMEELGKLRGGGRVPRTARRGGAS
jgi:hypothetical protein